MSIIKFYIWHIYFNLNCTEIDTFYPLDVVGRGRETQLRAGKFDNSAL